VDELTWDEVDSLAESNREILLSETLDGDHARDAELSVVGYNGVWNLYVFGTHIMAHQKFYEVDQLDGVTRHVGIVEGKCDFFCRGHQVDSELVEALPQKVRRGGVEWTLEPSSNYGEPMYVSDLGWVSAPRVFERVRVKSCWVHGDNGDGDSKKSYPTYKKAMDAQLKQLRSRKAHCYMCGQRLKREITRREWKY
jgi:hypothetical protein